MSQSSSKISGDIYILEKDKLVTWTEPKMEESYEYPSKYFNGNKNKPVFAMEIYSDNLNDSRAKLVTNITQALLDIKLLRTYLYLLGPTIEEICHEDWKSYGVVIGSLNSKIHPTDILDWHVTSPTSCGISAAGNISDKDDKWLLIYALAAYRLSFTSDQGDYFNNVKKNLLVLMKSAAYTASTSFTKQEHVKLDEPYGALVASYDMFFYKFSKNFYAGARFGSLITRYQDSSILSTLGYICNAAGFEKQSKIFQWCFHKCLSNEAIILLEGDDEFGDLNSYLPYARCFRLTQKSPYSASVCKNIHNMLHIVGAIRGWTRSVNARMIEGGDMTNVPKIAAMMIIAQRASSSLQRSLFESKKDAKDSLDFDAQQERLKKGKGQTGLNKVPKTQNAREWFYYFKTKNFTFDQEEKDWIKLMINKNATTRPGSIGSFVKDQFLSCI